MDAFDKFLTKILLIAGLLLILFCGYRLAQFEVIYNSKLWQKAVEREIGVLQNRINSLQKQSPEKTNETKNPPKN